MTDLTEEFINLVKYFYPNLSVKRQTEPVFISSGVLGQCYSRAFKGSLEELAQAVYNDTSSVVELHILAVEKYIGPTDNDFIIRLDEWTQERFKDKIQ
ncbi:hypothetical protein vBSdyM006_101 [Shigella phage vB_SdyM_006]|nr:hypothetical protein vBSdyM006_101 [Shigella phage vB_SdyM_006]